MGCVVVLVRVGGVAVLVRVSRVCSCFGKGRWVVYHFNMEVRVSGVCGCFW